MQAAQPSTKPRDAHHSAENGRGANVRVRDDARAQQDRAEAEWREFAPRDETATPQRKLDFVKWADVSIDDEDDLIAGVLPREGVAALYAPSQAGKSVVALDIAGRLAKGDSVFAEGDTERVGVIYCVLEGARGVMRRVKAMKARYGKDLPFALMTSGVDFRAASGPDVQNFIAQAKAHAAWFSEFGVSHGLVVIDTLAAATPGMNESSSEGMTGVISALKAIQAALGGLVLVNAHPGKDTERGIRGHSSLLAALDTTLEITWNGVDPQRELWLRKEKDGACNRPLATFTIDALKIGQTKKGFDITGAVAVWGDAPAPQTSGKRPRKAPPGVPTVRKALTQLLSEGGERPPAVCQAGSQHGVLRDALSKRAVSLGLVESDVSAQTRRQVFKRAMDWLREDGREIHERDGWVWFDPGVTERDTSHRSHSR